MNYLWELLAVAGSIIVFLYSYHSKKSYLPAYLVGIIFGLFWEVATEPLFNYQNFAFYIWKDVPLAIILGWGVSIAGFKIISDLIHSKYKIKFNTLESLAIDLLVAGILGVSMEFLGSHNFAIYTYSLSDIPILAGMPFIWPVGWLIIGLLNLSLVRRIENLRKY